MNVKIVAVLLIVVCLLELSYAKREGGKHKKGKEEKKKEKEEKKAGKKKDRLSSKLDTESTDMMEMKHEIEELREKVKHLPKNAVHIHMHDGHEEEEHRHRYGHRNETDDDAGDDHDDEQHVHLHMHVESDDCHGGHHHSHHDTVYHAHCEVEPNSQLQDGDDINGQIHLSQKGNGPVNIHIKINGFDMTKEHATHTHGFHIHTYGDLTDSCNSLGGHYNPHGTVHSGKNETTRHVGDLGNIECDMNGEIDHEMTDDEISLHGKYSLIGRSIAIHQGSDDLGKGEDHGSTSSGNAGPIIACCIIGSGNPKTHEDQHGDGK